VDSEQTTHVIFSEAVFPQEKEKNNEVVCVPLQMLFCAAGTIYESHWTNDSRLNS